MKARTLPSIQANIIYIIYGVFAVIFTWFFHELAHFATGELLGNNMTMTLNSVSSSSGKYSQSWHSTLISVAGPFITLCQAFIFFYLIKKYHNKMLYPFLFVCLYMRLMALAISILSNPNDEARISQDLGIGFLPLPLFVTGVLFYLVYRTSKREQYSWKFNLLTYLIITVASSIVILGDQAFLIRIF